MITLLLADDHQVLLDGIRSLLDGQQDLSVIGMARDGQEALEKIRATPVDVVLMDINMPRMNGLEACAAIKQEDPHVKVIAMSMYGEGQLVRSMLDKGASGYLLKSCGADELLEAIRTVHEGGTWLSREATTNLVQQIQGNKKARNRLIDPPSERELEVLRAIAEELTTDEIASKLGITPNTVETHRRNLLSKMGARNSAGLVRIAMEAGLIGG